MYVVLDLIFGHNVGWVISMYMLRIKEWFIIFRIVFSDRSFLINTFFFQYFRKLSSYSPNDTSKAFDRAVTRRTNVKFDPSQTIAILKLGQPDSELNDEQKLDLVKKYMDVSILVLNNFKNLVKLSVATTV